MSGHDINHISFCGDGLQRACSAPATTPADLRYPSCAGMWEYRRTGKGRA